VLNAAADLSAKVSDDWIRGSFYFQRAVVCRNLEEEENDFEAQLIVRALGSIYFPIIRDG